MTSKPPVEKELDPNEVVIKTSLGERLQICLGFIWFMRRAIVGTILIVGLAFIIYNSWSASRKTLDEHNSSPAYVVEDSEDPLELLGTEAEKVASLNDGSLEGAGSSIRDQPGSFGSGDIYTGKENTTGVEAASYDPILEEGTVEELVEALFSLKHSWEQKPVLQAFSTNKRRGKISLRLMELTDDENRQVFALNEYIESVIVSDFLVNTNDIDSPEVRTALLDITEKYQRHQSSAVRAKASLCGLSAPLHDYNKNRKKESLELFASRLDEFADRVFEDKLATVRICGLVLGLRKLRDWDGSALPYCEKLINKISESNNPDLDTVGVNLRERVYFGHLGINDFVSRLDQEDTDVGLLIEEFFSGLEAYPDFRMGFYQIAVSVLEKLKLLEQREEYESLIKRLGVLADRVSSEEVKSEIIKATGELEELPWGPRLEDNPESQDLGSPDQDQGMSETNLEN